MKTTNNLSYHCSKVAKNGEQYEIDICLNDVWKNGYEDFTLTGLIYEAGKVKSLRTVLRSGAIGKETVKHFPELQIFETLHLCDYLGQPMHIIENGFYFIDIEKWDKLKFANYYRLTKEQTEVLYNALTKEHFAFLILELNIFQQWKEEANKAIKVLEELTGLKFESKASRTHTSHINFDEIMQMAANGAFTPDFIQNTLNQTVNKK